MADVSHEFVARKLWLLVAVLTLPLTALAAVVGGALPLPDVVLGPVVTGIPIVGWFLLTPLLLLFGEEVADAVVGPPEGSDPAHGSSETTEDPVETLKRRYAAGDVGEAEFERRLERLLALDAVDADEGDVDSLLPGEDGDAAADDRSPGSVPDDEDLLERE